MLNKGVRIVSFLLLAVYMSTTVSYVMRPRGGEFDFVPTYTEQKKDTIDVVYFGGSSCFTYWAPLDAWGEYGFTSFNFANNALPAQLEKYCIKEALKTQSPELLIVDVRPFAGAERFDETYDDIVMYTEPRLRNFTDTFRYSLNRFMMIRDGVPERKQPLFYYFDLAKYHGNYERLALEENWRYALDCREDDAKKFGGFNFYQQYSAVSHTDYSHITEETVLSDNLNSIYLDLVEYCGGLDTEVLFIVPPYDEDEGYHRVHNYMARIAEENGIPFLNCNNLYDEIGMDPETDYYDGSHTQIFGARKYTKWLGQYLKKIYDLPDHRADSAYQDWDVAYEQWLISADWTEKRVLALMPEEVQVKVLEERNG